MKDIIADAHKKRFKAEEDEPIKKAIAISDAWLEELLKHPYHSRKVFYLISIGKAGTGVYLLRESAKAQREVKDRKMFKLSKRLVAEEHKDDENIVMGGAGEKRMKKSENKINAPEQPKIQQLGGAGERK
jgi:hypothetical protein